VLQEKMLLLPFFTVLYKCEYEKNFINAVFYKAREFEGIWRKNKKLLEFFEKIYFPSQELFQYPAFSKICSQ